MGECEGGCIREFVLGSQVDGSQGAGINLPQERGARHSYLFPLISTNDHMYKRLLNNKVSSN